MLSIVLKAIQTTPSCMEFEQALKLVNEILLAEKNRHLSDPETTILRGTWQGISYDEMAAGSQYSINYLMRDVGPNLWRSLSEILGEKVSKSNCRTVLDRYQSSGEQGSKTAIASKEEKRKISRTITQQTYQHWGEAPDLSLFFGRVAELQTLDRWIRQEKCRLVCLWGMGGMGKTALSRQFAETIKDEFDYLFWRSLGDRPSIPDLCREILQRFEPQEMQGQNRDCDISQILEYLRTHRCLLIFDDADAILQGSDRFGGYAEGYETYGQFFKRVGETSHRSCVLLNSREKLREIVLLENSTEFAHSWELQGLTLEAATKLFVEKKLTGQQSWPDLLGLYQGNPLALNLILVTIQNFFNGDVAQYMKIKATYLPAEITNILHERFAQISELERGILIHLARSDRALSLLELIEQMSKLELDDAIAAIESLQRRSLIAAKYRDRETEFTLKAVVRKYVTKYYATNGKP
ncbi:MAG: AAA family ATPase [Cyanobacteria bacterium SBLK]|nr:AAA family ATPase [Cyanobacteria bacterium SBLK]